MILSIGRWTLERGVRTSNQWELLCLIFINHHESARKMGLGNNGLGWGTEDALAKGTSSLAGDTR